MVRCTLKSKVVIALMNALNKNIKVIIFVVCLFGHLLKLYYTNL